MIVHLNVKISIFAVVQNVTKRLKIHISYACIIMNKKHIISENNEQFL